jgi:hypothetical protein
MYLYWESCFMATPTPESIRIMCPNLTCRKVLAVPTACRGKTVRCRSCTTNIRVPAANAQAVAAAAAAIAAKEAATKAA